MPLHPIAEKAALDWLRQHCPRPYCPFCQRGRFNLGDLVVAQAVPNHHLGPVILVVPKMGGPVPLMSLVPLTCMDCGYTAFFSAELMGVAT